MSIAKFISNASKRGVPLLACSTTDPYGAERQMLAANAVPIHLRWDCVFGFDGLNQASVVVAQSFKPPPPPGFEQFADNADPTVGEDPNWQAFFSTLKDKLPQQSRVYLHNGNRWLGKSQFIAGMQRFRDHAKARQQQLVLLGPDFELPPDLAPDVVCFDDPLPSDDELKEKVALVYKAVGLEDHADANAGMCIDYCRGMSLFQAEQNLFLSIAKNGMMYKALAERLAATIKNVRGLELYLPTIKFADVGGLSEAKRFFTRALTHNDDIDLVLWIDEIEKSGLAHDSDTSGVNADQLGQVLQFAADNKCIGVALTGTPGTGKSELCKALAGEFNVKVLRADLGATMSKYVGESQAYLRAMLRTAKAMGNRIMIVVTANDVQRLDDALISRIAYNFFFDLLSEEELRPIWLIQSERYRLSPNQFPSCHGWSGRDIMNCCDAASMMGIDLKEAAELIVPEAVRSAKKIEQRRALADGRLLSASYPGFYHKDNVTQERTITV